MDQKEETTKTIIDIKDEIPQKEEIGKNDIALKEETQQTDEIQTTDEINEQNIENNFNPKDEIKQKEEIKENEMDITDDIKQKESTENIEMQNEFDKEIVNPIEENEAQNQKATLEQVHKQRIENFKKMEKQRIEEMQTEHENQRKDFEADWSRSETLKTFNKPSSKLFQIRSQQRAMAISHDFKNARQLKKIGDQMQKEESQKATKKSTRHNEIEVYGIDRKTRKRNEMHD